MTKKKLPIRKVAAPIVSILSLFPLISCGGDRAAEPDERKHVIGLAETARSQMLQQKRFLRGGFESAPEIDPDGDIVTSDGNSFLYRSDSVIGSLDSVSAEFLFKLSASDSGNSGHEAMMRLSNEEDGWEPRGLYIR